MAYVKRMDCNWDGIVLKGHFASLSITILVNIKYNCETYRVLSVSNILPINLCENSNY